MPFRYLGKSSPSAESIKCKTSERRVDLANTMPRRPVWLEQRDKGENSRSKGHNGSGLDLRVKFTQ